MVEVGERVSRCICPRHLGSTVCAEGPKDLLAIILRKDQQMVWHDGSTHFLRFVLAKTY